MLHVVPAGALALPAGAATLIKNALMLDGATDYLQLSFSGEGSNTEGTISFWVRRNKTGEAHQLFHSRSSSGSSQLVFDSSDKIYWRLEDTGGNQVGQLTTTQVFRDVTAWQHVVVNFDTGNATADNRMRVYVNGSEITAFATRANPSQGAVSTISDAVAHYIGATHSPGDYADVSLAEYIYIDGIQLAASAFGENDSNGVWGPKDLSDTSNIADWGGSNSFWLKFDDGNNIGKNSRPTALTANAGTYKVDNSLWLDGSADELTFTPSQDGTGLGKKYTLSFWAKIIDPDSTGSFFCAGQSGGDSLHIQTDWSSGNPFLNFNDSSGGSSNWLRRTGTRVLRDPTAWIHICFAVDNSSGGGLAGTADAARVYINGVEDTSFANANSNPPSSDTSRMTMQYEHVIANGAGFSDFKSFYVAEFVIIDGQQLTPTSFGGWDANGNWVPVDPSTLTFGKNGTWLEFGDSSDIGKDSAGGGVKQNISSATVTQSGTADNGSGVSLKGTGGGGAIDGPSLVDDDTDDDGFYMGHSSNADCSGKNIDIDLGSGNDIAVTGIGWIAGPNNSSNNTGGVWSVFYSDNGTDYTDTGQNANFVGGQGETTKTEQRTLITGQTAHRYWRLHLDSHTANGNGWYSGIKFYAGGSSRFANNWTPVSITSAQVVTDSPTNTAGDNEGNYTTFNSIDKSSNMTLTNGNLTVTNTGAAAFHGAVATQRIPNSGKYYFEVTLPGTLSNQYIGVVNEANKGDFVTAADGSTSAGFYGFYPVNSSSSKIANGSSSSYGGSIGNSSVLGFAIDKDNDEMYVSDDGAFLASSNPVTRANPMLSSLPDNLYVAMTAHNSGGHSVTFNFGQTAFAGSVPTGYKRLNTADLAAPTVTDPRAHYATALYTGTAQSKTVRACFDSTGTAWTPDFVWVKCRSNVGEHVLVDSVRGAANVLTPDSAAAEFLDVKAVTSFIEGGFTLGNGDDRNDSNDSAKTYVAWCMKAGGAPTVENDNTSSAMDDGSVFKGGVVQTSYTPSGSPSNYPQKMSIASHGGFSIVKYTGTGANATVPHGLSRTPTFFMLKPLTQAHGWAGYHSAYGTGSGNDKVVRWDTDHQGGDQAGDAWQNNPFANAHTITFGSQTGQNESGTPHIMYTWARTPGMIGIGSYAANADADGTTVVIDDGASGFRPAWLMVKNIVTGSRYWVMLDSARNTFNPVQNALITNETLAEDTGYLVDFTANGFKLRVGDSTQLNTGTNTHIYLAFADQPFNLARAR